MSVLNREELKAILWVMTRFGKIDPPLFVYSDSAYCVNTLTNWMYGWEQNGWVKSDGKRPENVGIIKAYRTLEKLGHKIVLLKCSGHNGVKWNEYADQLATGKIIIEKKEEENKEALDISIKATSIVDEDIYKKLLHVYDK